ncbi:hypothetical protein VTO42DRAFT_6013 [Malbranchea cinnamomea]
MWLDRLTTHSNASGPSSTYSRAYSPVGRPPSHLQNRPTFSPRSSSLSLSSTPNASTSSLPGTLRHTNGSNLRFDPRKTSATVARDPLEVLETIIGKRSTERSLNSAVGDSTGKPATKPEEFAQSIDFGDLSLEQFVSSRETDRESCRTIQERRSVEQFEKEQYRFLDLHNSIAGCDDVLKSVESYLEKFQKELGAVSAEIETLQSRSVQLSSQLQNRKNVEKLLGPAVEGITISPHAVRLISEGPINQDWLRALNEVENCSAAIETSSSLYRNIKAVEDVKPLLSDLKDKAIERIRDYIVAQIKAIRSPNINAQIIQQQALLKYKDLYTYLSKHHPVLAEELSQAYINTMRWYYISNFTRYNQALEKLKLHAVDRNDLLGGDPVTHRGANILPGGRNQPVGFDPFALGRRIDILKYNNPMALSSYLAEEDKSFHGIEVPFRNFNLALIDNISAEYSFMTEMFAAKSAQQASRKVMEIFEPVLSLGHSLTKRLIDESTDCLGMLLCVRLNQQFAFELQRRKVPVADTYINGNSMQLWPRFQVVMDMHCESFKKAAANVSRSSSSALSLTGGDSKQSSAPHFLTQRFGQFLHSILSLSSHAKDNEPVSNSLGRLVGEFDSLLVKLSRASGDPKRRERFLFNNYSLILTIINDTNGKLASEQKQHFEAMAKQAASHR